MTAESKARDALCSMGERLYSRHLVHGSSGNLSLRLDDGWLVTPTNACLGFLDPARLSKLDLDGRHVSGDAPTKEALLHRSVYAVRPNASAIIHTHSTHSVAVSCLDHRHDEPPIPPLTAYYVMRVGDLVLVPYYRPGDARLAQAVQDAASRNPVVLLANHGPVVSSRTLEEAMYALEELEETAKLHLLLQGQRTRPLNAFAIDDLRAAFGS